ncbi:MAG: oligosaccharide flippase family protein [Bacteroidota bacterium]
MGIVRKQSIQSSIVSYVGAVLGFVNKVLIFTQFLTEEEVGLANILLTLGLLYATFSSLGYVNVILRFFPYFRDRERQHHGFLSWALVISTLGFLFITLNFVLLKPLIVERFSDNSPLLIEYYYYIVPLGLFSLYFQVFESYLRSLFKTVVPVLFQEVIQKLFVMASVLIYAAGWVDFEGFVMIYVGLISSVTLLMVFYIAYLRQLHLRLRISWRFRKLNYRMLVFGGFTLLSNISVIVLFNIDSIMLADFKGMDAVGIYTTAYYITALLLIPWRAIQKITSPLVAEYWQAGKMADMDRLYKRTSLINFVLGAFLFLGLMTNAHNLFALMPASYSGGLVVLFFIGLTRVIDMLTGLNGYILITSRLYRYDLIFNGLLVVFAVLLNWLLIPPYGISGAALATGLSVLLGNLFRLIFVWYHFKLQPFTWPMLLVLVVTGAAFAVQMVIPRLDWVWLDLIVRGGVVVLVYGGLTLLLRVTPDANNLLRVLLKRLGVAEQN